MSCQPIRILYIYFSYTNPYRFDGYTYLPVHNISKLDPPDANWLLPLVCHTFIKDLFRFMCRVPFSKYVVILLSLYHVQ